MDWDVRLAVATLRIGESRGGMRRLQGREYKQLRLNRSESEAVMLIAHVCLVVGRLRRRRSRSKSVNFMR